MNNKKGFTLIELLVVVLIIGILAAMAMPAYFKAVERSRTAEADTLIGTVVNSQQRYRMKTGNFATNWTSLDIAPVNATTSAYYCTKGTQPTGNTAPTDCGTGVNGFLIQLVGSNGSTAAANTNGVIATRVGTGQYQYSLQKQYNSTQAPVCIDTTDDDALLCADYAGIDGDYTTPTTGLVVEYNG